MTLEVTITGMVLCLLVWAIATWREKKKQLGDVALIPHIYYKYSVLIVFLVLSASLFSTLTGIEWESPFRR